MYYKHWIDSGIIFVRDIYNTSASDFITSESLLKRLTVKNNWLCEFTCVKMLIGLNSVLKDNYTDIEMKNTTDDHTMWFNSCIVPIEKLTSRYLYNAYVCKNVTIPTAQIYWDTVSPSLNWRKIWMAQTLNIKENKLREFNFKILHRILPCKLLLNKWKILNTTGNIYNPVCELCNTVENYMHMFIHCKRLRGYWEEIFKRIFDRHIDIDIKSVLLSESSNCHLTLAKYAILL